MSGITVEPLNTGYMASLGTYLGVGETKTQAIERLFEKLPRKRKKKK